MARSNTPIADFILKGLIFVMMFAVGHMFSQSDTGKKMNTRVVEKVSDGIDKATCVGKGGIRGAVADTAIHATGLSGDIGSDGRTQASMTVDRTIGVGDEVRENVAMKAGTATFKAVAQKVNDGFKTMKADQTPVSPDVLPRPQEDVETLYPSW